MANHYIVLCMRTGEYKAFIKIFRLYFLDWVTNQMYFTLFSNTPRLQVQKTYAQYLDFSEFTFHGQIQIYGKGVKINDRLSGLVKLGQKKRKVTASKNDSPRYQLSICH